MSDGIKVTGDSEFQRKLKQVMERAPDRIDIQLIKMGRKLRKMARDRTPEKKGRLKRSYKLSEPGPTKQRDGHEITMTNTAPHFHLIEKGHKVAGKKDGLVKGRYMVETAAKELEEEMPQELNEWIDDLFKELM